MEKLSVKEFISLAMVPVYVSAALAFGLMFLGLVMGATSTWTTTGTSGTLKSGIVEVTPPTGDNKTTTFKFWNNETAVTLKTIGLLDSEVKNGASKALDIGKGVIGTIIMNVLALAILWMAVMAALGASKITEAAVAPIKWFGDEIGKLAMKSPQYIPIPLWKGKDGKDRSISMAGLWSVSSTVQWALNTRAAEQGGNLGKTFAEKLGVSVSELTSALNSATGKLQSQTDPKLQKEIWRDIYQKIGDDKTFDAHKETLIPNFKAMLGATKNIDDGKRKDFQELLDKEPKKFVVEFEKYMDAHPNTFGGGMVASKEQATSNSIFQAVKAGNVTSRYMIGTDKKIHINIDGKKSEELTYKIDGANIKTEQGTDIGDALKSKWLSQDEVNEIIKKIKEQSSS